MQSGPINKGRIQAGGLSAVEVLAHPGIHPVRQPPQHVELLCLGRRTRQLVPFRIVLLLAGPEQALGPRKLGLEDCKEEVELCNGREHVDGCFEFIGGRGGSAEANPGSVETKVDKKNKLKHAQTVGGMKRAGRN